MVWCYLSACYLINRMPSSVLNKRSLITCLYANKTTFSMTPRVLGCICFVQDLSPGLDKLSPRSINCVFVGYFKIQKKYWCYNPCTRKYLVSADVTSLNLFHISLHRFLLPYMRLFFLHCLCHCLHLLLLFLHQCRQQKLKIHLHQSQFEISDTSTLIAQKFPPLNQFWLIPLR